MYNDFSDIFNSDTLGIGLSFLFTIFMVTFFFCLIIGVFKIICEWIIFKKAGKEGWEAVIPYYGLWTYYEISGYPGWFALVSLGTFIPYIGWAAAIAILVFNILAGISLAKKFGKSEGFGILLALLPIIGLPILAFGKDEYDGSLGEQKNIQK